MISNSNQEFTPKIMIITQEVFVIVLLCEMKQPSSCQPSTAVVLFMTKLKEIISNTFSYTGLTAYYSLFFLRELTFFSLSVAVKVSDEPNSLREIPVLGWKKSSTNLLQK